MLAGFGLPMALCTDRAGWAFHTPTAADRVDRTHLTVVGRILARLGIEHIPSYSPQAGPSRAAEPHAAGPLGQRAPRGRATLEAANAYLREPFIADYNREVTRPPADPASAFVPVGEAVDLDHPLAEDAERLVGPDNVVSSEGV